MMDVRSHYNGLMAYVTARKYTHFRYVRSFEGLPF